MSLSSTLGHVYSEAKGNKWFHYFAVFCRIVLAMGFIPSGLVKVMGERFTALPVNHPLGHYLEALYYTEYYYTFIGILQLAIALLLLIPRTALLGALMYFPIIMNICILAYAVRFEGTRITTLMVLANIYLLCWDYDRIKYILPFKERKDNGYAATEKPLSKKFPFLFFGFVLVTTSSVIVINHFLYDIRPGNSQIECTNGCPGNRNPKACEEFCNCIYNRARSLHDCLKTYDNASASVTNQ
jgi:uncharacterized membrane protein YphA (DoxX/SURF4 family)